MHFLWPQFLWLMLALPLLVVLYVWLLRRKKKMAVRYASLSIIKEAMGKGQTVRHSGTLPAREPWPAGGDSELSSSIRSVRTMSELFFTLSVRGDNTPAYPITSADESSDRLNGPA